MEGFKEKHTAEEKEPRFSFNKWIIPRILWFEDKKKEVSGRYASYNICFQNNGI